MYDIITKMFANYRDVIIPSLKKDILKHLDSYIETINLVDLKDYSVKSVTDDVFGDDQHYIKISKVDTDVVQVHIRIDGNNYKVQFDSSQDERL